jgi:small subunit ribosomal protein S6
VVVFDGTLPDDVLQKEQKLVEDIIKQNANLEKTDVWGKRALAFNIKKKKNGFYCLFLFEGEGTVVTALDKYIKLNDHILRHLTVVRNVKNDIARAAAAARKEKVVEGDKSQNEDDSDE